MEKGLKEISKHSFALVAFYAILEAILLGCSLG